MKTITLIILLFISNLILGQDSTRVDRTLDSVKASTKAKIKESGPGKRMALGAVLTVGAIASAVFITSPLWMPISLVCAVGAIICVRNADFGYAYLRGGTYRYPGYLIY